MPMLDEMNNQGEGGTKKQPNRGADNTSIKDAMKKVDAHGDPVSKEQDLGEPVVDPDQGETGPFKADDSTPGKKSRRADKDNAEPMKDMSKSKMVKTAYESILALEDDVLAERWDEIAAAIAGTLNENSVDISEEVSNLLADESDLSEDFKKKATVIFESKINTAIREQKAILEDVYQSRLDEEVEEVKSGLMESLDSYLEYVAEKWMEENEIAVENGIKAELSESFITGMVNLFKEHNVNLPDDKSDVLSSIAEERDSIKEALDNSINANLEAQKELNELRVEKVISESCSDLTDTEKSKLKELAETVSYDSVEELSEKLNTLKESHFGNAGDNNSDLLNEDVLSSEDATKDTDGKIVNEITQLADAIAKADARQGSSGLL